MNIKRTKERDIASGELIGLQVKEFQMLVSTGTAATTMRLRVVGHFFLFRKINSHILSGTEAVVCRSNECPTRANTVVDSCAHKHTSTTTICRDLSSVFSG